MSHKVFVSGIEHPLYARDYARYSDQIIQVTSQEMGNSQRRKHKTITENNKSKVSGKGKKSESASGLLGWAGSSVKGSEKLPECRRGQLRC